MNQIGTIQSAWSARKASSPASPATAPEIRAALSVRCMTVQAFIYNAIQCATIVQGCVLDCTPDERYHSRVCKVPLWLNDQRADHAGFAVAGNMAVEGVAARRVRLEE